MIGLIAVTASGRAAATRLAEAWPGRVQIYHGPARKALPRAWSQCEELVCFLAVGATVRIIAPLLDSKWTDPAVVCVDESSRHAVAVVGGHAAGANALAARVADVLGADPVITTATDVVGLPGLDMLGWPTEGAIGVVSRAMLDGEQVRLESDGAWPLPPLPDTIGSAGDYRILVTDRVVPLDRRSAILRPPSLVVGVGSDRGAGVGEILGLLDAALTQAGLSPASVTALACLDASSAEPGIVEAARRREWPVLAYPASRLAAVEAARSKGEEPAAAGAPGTQRPADAEGPLGMGWFPGSAGTAGAAGTAASAGTAGSAGTGNVAGIAAVAEAAALAGADRLVALTRASANAAVALARVRPRGRLALVGLGPGPRDLLTPRAAEELRRASVVVGLDRHVDEVRDLLRPGTQVLAGGPGEEHARARAAVDRARQGRAVALVGSGDAGAYAMASPVMGLVGEEVDVVAVPGVTAEVAAAALLGAPLGHDHAVIALCDPQTPWEAVETRVRAAAEADFLVVFHHLRGHGREWQLGAALGILARCRPPDTPAAVLRDAEGPGQHVQVVALSELDPQQVDMRGVVVVGASGTRVVGGRMVLARR